MPPLDSLFSSLCGLSLNDRDFCGWREAGGGGPTATQGLGLVLDMLLALTPVLVTSPLGIHEVGGGGSGARLAVKESLIDMSFLLMDIVPVEAFLD